MVKCTTKARMYRLGGSRMKGKGKGTGKGNLKLWSPPLGSPSCGRQVGGGHHFPSLPHQSVGSQIAPAMPLSPSSTGNKVPCSKCPCAAAGGGAGKGVGASCGAGKATLPLSKGNKGVSPASALLIAAAAAYTGFAYGKNLHSKKTSAGGSGSRTAGSKPKAAAVAANGKAPAAKPAPLPPVTDFEKSLMPWTQLATATGGAGGVCARRVEITNKVRKHTSNTRKSRTSHNDSQIQHNNVINNKTAHD